MALLIRCPECEAQNRTEDKFKGKNVSCSVCGISFKVTDKAEFVPDEPKKQTANDLDEDDKPQKRKSKRADLDDEDDDRSNRSKRKSRENDDEDEDDRPRRGRSHSNDHARGHTRLMGGAGMSQNAKIIGGIVGGVFVLAIVGVVFWQVNKAKTKIEETQQQQQKQQPKSTPYEEATANIRKADGNAKRDGLRWFAGNNPANPQQKSEGLTAILPLLQDAEAGTVREAVHALRKWGGAENSLDVAKVVSTHSDRGVRETAMDLLGEWKDPRTVEVLVNRLMQPPMEDRKAADTLQKIGPAAEDGILDKFDTLTPKAQIHACKVLAQIGTKKSTMKLEEAVTKAKNGKDIDSRSLLREANNALTAIRLRDK